MLMLISVQEEGLEKVLLDIIHINMNSFVKGITKGDTIFIPYQNDDDGDDDDDDDVIENSNYKDIPPWDPGSYRF